MSDLYSECLVKKEPTSKDAAVKYGLIALIVLFVAAGLFLLPILLIGAVALGVAAYFIIPGTDLEYEYLFVNGELDIDKIMAKSKRRKSQDSKSRGSGYHCSSEFPPAGLLQRKQPAESLRVFLRESGS